MFANPVFITPGRFAFNFFFEPELWKKLKYTYRDNDFLKRVNREKFFAKKYKMNDYFYCIVVG